MTDTEYQVFSDHLFKSLKQLGYAKAMVTWVDNIEDYHTACAIDRMIDDLGSFIFKLEAAGAE